jgi:Secretion system C-terminal sorting domain
MKNIVLIICFIFSSVVSFAQLEKLVVEKYYISDANDATDTTGGGIAPGTVTYRVYADLLPNTRIKRIFGTSGHPFIVSSTQPFFNNKSQGQSFGKDFSKVFLSENTTALDTYITIGQVAKQGSKLFFGIPKEQDSDGSFIGGLNNDGGSQMILSGLLINNDTLAGIPLTESDGIDTMNLAAVTWTSFGIQDFVTQSDSTIFGSLVEGSLFESENFYFQSSQGIDGVSPDTNFVLLAQLTTLGELTFEMNLELEFWQDTAWITQELLARDTILGAGQSFSPFLSYPFECGCMNSDYLEYNSAFICEQEGACQTLAIIGCMDTLACNYSAEANVSFEEICCYPGDCGGRDIEWVCPLLNQSNLSLNVFPNPAQLEFSIKAAVLQSDDVSIEVYNAMGIRKYLKQLNQFSGVFNDNLTIADWEPGVYYVLLKNTTDQVSVLLVRI